MFFIILNHFHRNTSLQILTTILVIHKMTSTNLLYHAS